MDSVRASRIAAWARRWRLGLALLIWGAGTAVAYEALLRYETTPGRGIASVPQHWPAPAGLDQTSGKATLVMAAHPECPCSKASLSEIAELLARHPNQLAVYVLFVMEPEAGINAQQCRDSKLWQQASAIQGVTCMVDQQNAATELFHASTSGQVFLYDAQGTLRFSGGVTAGRDHAGPNAGIDAIADFLDSGRVALASTPVFGCALR